MNSDAKQISNPSDWIAEGLVVVKYPKGDLTGMFFGYYSLLVYEIQAIYITLFLWNRDLLTFYCCFTHMLSEVLVYIVKHILKHPRPEHGAPSGGLFEGRYGMPSQHCHCFAYLVAMILLLVFHYYKDHVCKFKKKLALLIATTGLFFQVLGRAYLKFHTLNQCVAGVAFGFVSAIVFYIIGINLFLPHSDYICRICLLRFFSFRKDLISAPPERQDCEKQIKPIKTARLKPGRPKYD